MARFHYTAERPGGEVYRGFADVSDRFELYQLIRREGGKVVSVGREKEGNWLSIGYWNSLITTVPEQEKIIFARSLGSMLTAGLSLSRAISIMERQTRNAKFIRIISDVGDSVRRGSTFHEALAAFPHVFSDLFVSMVRAGEESGDMPTSLKTIAEQMDSAYSLKKRIRSALIYPAIIVVAIIAIGILMLTEVVPTLAQTFDELGAELPMSTKAIIGTSNFLVENTILVLGIMVIVVSGVILGLRTREGRRVRDMVFLHVPIIGGIVREVNSARTARTLNSLLSAGVDMLSAISITGEVVQNSYFRDVLTDARKSVEKGKPLSRPFSLRDDLYPPLVGEMIAVGEETGQLAPMLGQLALFYEDEVARKTKDMSAIIEPFLMVLIGVAVGFFAVAMISPIYGLSDSL